MRKCLNECMYVGILVYGLMFAHKYSNSSEVCFANILSTTGDLWKPVRIILSSLTITDSGINPGLSQCGPLKHDERLAWDSWKRNLLILKRKTLEARFSCILHHPPPCERESLAAAGSHVVTMRIANLRLKLTYRIRQI